MLHDDRVAPPRGADARHVAGYWRIQQRRDSWPDVAALRRESEHDRSVARRLGARRERRRDDLAVHLGEASVFRHQHDVGAVASELLRERADARRPDEQRVHFAPPPPVESARARAAVVASSATLRSAVPRLSANTRMFAMAQSTFASVWRRRTSSGTAATPSPMMRPAGRSGGSSIDFTRTRAGPSCAGLLSSGFFFAAMMFLSEG